jgi:hypothetical protein
MRMLVLIEMKKTVVSLVHQCSASMFPASPHCRINQVICSIVDVSSCPGNLVKSDTLNPGRNSI